MSEHPQDHSELIEQHIDEIKKLIEKINPRLGSSEKLQQLLQQHGTSEELHKQFKQETRNREAVPKVDERLEQAVSDANQIKKQAIELEKLLQQILEEFRQEHNY